MNIEEALECVDMWNDFKKPRVNSRGLSMAAAVLADEVRRRHGIGGELIAARRDRDALLNALDEAKEMVEDWGGYASDYFKEKYNLDRDIAKLDARIKAVKPE